MKKFLLGILFINFSLFTNSLFAQNAIRTSNTTHGNLVKQAQNTTSDKAKKIKKNAKSIPNSANANHISVGFDNHQPTSHTSDSRNLPLNENGNLISVDGGEVTFIHHNQPDSTHWCWTPTPFTTDANRDPSCSYSVPCDNPANRDAAATTIKYFQLVWHVMTDGGPSTNISQTTINNLMAELNADYASHNMVFCADPANFYEDPVNYTHNENTEEVSLKTTYNVTPTQVINIYVVGTMGPGGYARFPYDPMGGTSPTGGIVLNRGNCWVGSHTLAHEMGHVFGLEHTFAGVDERGTCSNCYEKVRNVNGSSNTSGVPTPNGGPYLNEGDREGDWCSDTNPHNTNAYNCNTSSAANGACDAFPWANAPVNNHMSYSFCSSQFTAQQSRRMHCMVNTYLGAWTAYGGGVCGALPPVADFVGNPTTWVDPASVTFTDLSAPTAIITTWTWNFNNAANPNAIVTPATFVGQNPPAVVYDVTSGVCEQFEVSLTVSGPNGSDTETKTAYIEVCPPAGDCDTLDAQLYDAGPTWSIWSGVFGYLTGVPVDGYAASPAEPAGFYEMYFTPTPGSSIVGTVNLALGELVDADGDLDFQVVVYEDDGTGFPDIGAGPVAFQVLNAASIGIPTSGNGFTFLSIDFECPPTIAGSTFHVGVEMFPDGDGSGELTDELILLANDDGEGDGLTMTNFVLSQGCGLQDYNDPAGLFCPPATYAPLDMDMYLYPTMGWAAPFPYAAGFTESLVCDTTDVQVFTGTLYDCNDTQTGHILNWSYTFASDGITINSTSEVPVLNMTYATPGPDVLTITAVNECGRGDTTSWVIPYNMNQTPAADFTMAQTNPVCLGTPIDFTGQPNSGMYSYTWDFGDGTTIGPGNLPTSPAPATGTFPNPSYTYGAVGTYYVDMEVSSYGLQPGGPSIFAEGFELGWPGWTRRNGDALAPAAPMAGLGFGTTAATSWLALDVDGDGVTEATSTSWYNPAGVADDWFRTPLVAIPAAGNHGLFWTGESFSAAFPDGYEVRLRVGTVAVPNAVNYPTVLYSTTAENAFETNHVVDLTPYAGSSVSIAFRNNTNDGFLLMIDSIRVAPLSLACTSNRRYLDFVEVIDCSVQPPVYTLDATPTSGCAPLDVDFQSTFVSGDVATSFTWNFGDGGFAFVEDPGIHTYTTAGTYFVTYEVCNSGGCNTYNQTIVVDDVPTTSNAGPNQSQCGGTTATLAGNVPVIGTGVWTVISGGGSVTTPTANNSGVTGLTTGANTFEWTVTNGVCTSSSQVTITVSTPPNAGTNGTHDFCSTDAAADLFSDLGGSPDAGGTWSGPSILTGADLGTFDPATNTGGSYTYTVTGGTAVPFWTEDFGTDGVACSSQGTLASGIVTANGTWSTTDLGSEATSNLWYVSTMEAGVGAGNCSDGCGLTPGLTNRTLHISNQAVGLLALAADNGAVYFDDNSLCGGFGICTITDYRVESPTIDCSLQSTITLDFNYLEGGNVNDDATVWYFDGAIWSQLANMTKTTTVGSCVGGQLEWESYSIALPASADNNPNVKIGFRWVSNGDGVAADPSIAVDDITLSVSSAGCPPDVATVDVTIETAPDAGTNNTLNICASAAPTDLFSQLGGTPDATGTWSGPSVLTGGNLGTFDPSTNLAGVYTYTVAGTVCSNASSTVTVNITAAPDPGTNGTHDFCSTGTTADLFSDLGGTPQSGGTWTGPSALAGGDLGTFDPSTNPAGTYTYTVTVAGCGSLSADVVVNVETAPDAGIDGAVTYCNAGPGGDLFTELGGTPQATGTWSPALTSGTGVFDPLLDAANTYTYTVNGTVCPNATADVVVTIETSPDAGIDGAVTYCDAGPGGDLFTELGGTPQATGTWSPALTSGTGVFDPLSDAANTYTYTITGTVCPSSSADVVVSFETAPDAGTSNTLNICAIGAPTDLFSILGGTPDATGTWSGPSALTGGNLGTFDPSTNASGVYTYTVTGTICSNATATVTVNITAAPDAGTNGTHDFCSTGTTADLFSDLGGTPQNGGVWTGPSALTGGDLGTFDPATNTAGTYTYTVNVIGCGSLSADVVVTIETAPDAGIDGAITYCDAGPGGDLFTELGGTPQATGTWSPALTSGTGVFDPLLDAANTYTYTVSGTVCANVTADVVVTIETSPDAGIDGAVTYCDAGPGGDLFTELGGSPQATGTWSPALTSGTGVFDPLSDAANTYTYTVSGTVCANATADVVVTLETTPDAGIDGTHTFCSSDAAADLFNDLTGTPQATGTWSPALTSGTGVFDPAVDAAGTYTYTVSGTVCSSATADVIVSVNTAPNAGTGNTIGICATAAPVDLFTQLGGSPDATGTWSPALTSGTGVFDPSVDAGGAYTYTVIGTSPCVDATAIITVNITAADDPAFVYPDFCAGSGGIPTSQVTPGGTWAFNPNPGDGSVIDMNTGVITGEVAGSTYMIEYTTPAGPCQSSGIQAVNIGTPVDAGTNGTHDFCSSDLSADLFSDLGGTPNSGGTWSPALTSGTGVFDPAVDAANTFTYTVTGSNGCPNASADVVVSIETAPNAGIDGSLNICASSPATDLFLSLGGTPDVTGTWSPAMTSGTGVFDPAVDAAATYTYTVTGTVCSSAQADVVVSIVAADDPTFTYVDYCAGTVSGPSGIVTTGGTFTFNPLPGDGATIDPTTGVISNEVAGNSYTVQYNTPVGPCQDSSTVTITIGTPVDGGIDGNTRFCSTDTGLDLFTILGGTPDIGGTWSPAMSSGTGVFDPATDAAGIYTYTVTGTNGCPNGTADVTVIVDMAPDVADAGIDQTLCDTTTLVTLSGNTPTNGTGIWTIVSGSGTFTNANNAGTTVTNPGIGSNDYMWTISSGSCTPTTDVVTIILDPCANTTIVIPTGFTPDGDGVNDVWELTNASNYPNIHVEIYNRWGGLLFMSDGYGTPWDGKNNGKMMPLGSYYFTIELGDGSNPIKGTVTIIK